MYASGVNAWNMLRKDPELFWHFYPAAMTRMAVLKFTGKKIRSKIYGGHRLYSQAEGNEKLKELIVSGKPFMFGRNGTNEAQITTVGVMLEKDILQNVDSLPNLPTQCEHCGFFPLSAESIKDFSAMVRQCTKESDIYGSLFLFTENYIVKKHCSNDVFLTHTNMLDFWRYERPFTEALAGKRVLVVHPLAAQIEEQYQKRALLFDNPHVLPEFELKTVQAVQTIAGERDARFDTWSDALDYMTAEVAKQEFDIAILGCGAYGMPLAARIKQMGKQAIYMGGVTQMLFGIRGKRWDAVAEAAGLYNEHWVSPDAALKPKQSDSVEGGCYW